MLLLPIVENCKVDFKVVPNGITSIPNAIQIRPAVLELNTRADRQTDMTSPVCVHLITSCKKRIKSLCLDPGGDFHFGAKCQIIRSILSYR
jgi:hypothetical protein